MRIAFRRSWPDLSIDDGKTVHRCRLAVVSNGSRYGGPFVVCPDGMLSKPGLHVVMLKSDDPLSMAWFGLNLLMNRLHNVRGVSMLRVDSLEISAPDPVPVQLDGDPFAYTPLSIRRVMRPLDILVP